MELGEKIRSLRAEKGMTQAELAEKLFVSVDLVSKWEIGRRTPDYGTVSQIAQLLGTEPDNLLDRKSAVFQELSECADPETEIPEERLRQIAESFLKGLRPEDAGLFLQKYYFLKRNAELARDFGMKENHVRASLSRLRKKLKKYIKENVK